MVNHRQSARRLAQKGRGRDKYLLHITGDELQRLASTGLLTTNPETGLPEAGFFSNILSAAAPIVGGFFGGPLGAALGGAVSTAVQGGDLSDVARGAVSGGVRSFVGGELFGGGAGDFAPGDVVEAELGDAFAGSLAGGTPEAITGSAAGMDAVDSFPADFDFGTAGLSLLGGGLGQMPSRLVDLASSIPWPTVSKAVDIGSGLYGLLQSRRLQQLAKMRAAQADPFGPYRAGYAQQLAQLSADPTAITRTPGWDAGIQAIRRSAAGQGYLDSGNEISMLQNFGGQAFDREAARLANLAGAGFNPANAAQLELEGRAGAMNLAGQSLNRISRGVGGLWR